MYPVARMAKDVSSIQSERVLTTFYETWSISDCWLFLKENVGV